MYSVKLVCCGVPETVGAQGAIDITEEFTHRPWHTKAICSWTGSCLVLEAENDFDDNGLATQDEFSDAISACISDGFDGDLKIESVTEY